MKSFLQFILLFNIFSMKIVEDGGGGESNQNENPDSGNQEGGGADPQDQNNNEEDPTPFNVADLPKEAQDLIKSLRSESADHRTKNNNLNTRLENIEKGMKTMFGGEGGEQDLTPEQQVEQLQQSHESVSYENAVMGIAYENGIPKENYEYFNFLMDKAVNGLEEGQELSEEMMTEVISKATMNGAGSGNTNSSVDGQGNQNNGGQDPTGQSGVTLDSFVKMGMMDKSELYRKSPAIYNQFMKQAREQRLL